MRHHEAPRSIPHAAAAGPQPPAPRRPLRGISRGAAALLAAAAGGSAAGQVVTVDTVEDIVDFALPQTLAQLPGPDGRVSFREACLAVSNTPGPQTIEFAIPRSEWWLYDDRALLRLDFDVCVISDDETTIDFTSQTRFTGDTNPEGNEVAMFGVHPGAAGTPAIYINADNCVVRGLDVVMQRGYGVELAGSNNRVVGSTISGPLYAAVYISGGWGGQPASGNIVGGTAPEDGNILSAGNHGVRIDTPADNNIVIGNQLSGVFAGVAVRGNPYTGVPVGNRIGGPTPEERNIIAGAGKYGEEGFPVGAQVELVMAHDTLIEGNFIGTTPDGLGRPERQIGPAGIEVADSVNTVIRDNVIGGIRVEGRNHYAGILFGRGIHVTAINEGTAGTLIEGNIIGAGADGETPVPNLYGVEASPFTARFLPVDTEVADSFIAFNERSGLLVDPLVSGVRVTGTVFRDNGELGIDLLPPSGGRGVTLNDPGDTDTGGNGLQNFPVLDSARAESGLRVEGSLSSRPGRSYTIEFFASDDCDGSGNGEGEEFIGSTQVTTDASGFARFAASVATPTGGRDIITATATDDLTGDTSEFSACTQASDGCSADCDDSSSLDFFDFLCFQQQFGAGDPLADCDGSGGLDFFDFLCFQNAFAAGCP